MGFLEVTLGIPLIVLIAQGELSRSLVMCTGTTPVGLEGMSEGLAAAPPVVPALGDTLPVSPLQIIS